MLLLKLRLVLFVILRPCFAIPRRLRVGFEPIRGVVPLVRRVTLLGLTRILRGGLSVVPLGRLSSIRRVPRLALVEEVLGLAAQIQILSILIVAVEG